MDGSTSHREVLEVLVEGFGGRADAREIAGAMGLPAAVITRYLVDMTRAGWLVYRRSSRPHLFAVRPRGRAAYDNDEESPL